MKNGAAERPSNFDNTSATHVACVDLLPSCKSSDGRAALAASRQVFSAANIK